MKKISLLTLAILVSAPAFAVDMQNANFMTKKGELYASGTFGYMEKQTRRDGDVMAGIINNTGNVSYGITDITSFIGELKYTSNNDEGRNGMTVGQVGINHRIFGEKSPLILDVYYAASLAGMMDMSAEIYNDSQNTITGISLAPENYTSGRWAGILGVKVGKNYEKFSHNVWGEVKHHLSGNNTKIAADDLIIGVFQNNLLTANGYANPRLKSGTDFSAGYKASYKIASKTTLAGGLSYKYFDSISVDKINLDNISISPASLPAAVTGGAKAAFANGLMNSMQDGHQEFIGNLGIYYSMADNSQVGVYAEYTHDDAELNQRSNKETQYKYELGFKFNYLF